MSQFESQKDPLSLRNVLLAISFFEGAAVMVIELLGAKIIAPFYGTSMYVWASVLGITLASLALGYYAGGLISEKYKGVLPLYIVLGIGGLFTLVAPQIAPGIMVATADFGVRTGSLLSVLVYLLPPIACMGMVSPIITQLINQTKENAGKSAGTVYAISTVGGILATFLSGFYLIPEFGIVATSLLTAGTLVVISLVGLTTQKKMVPAIALVVLGFLTVTLTSAKDKHDPNVTIQYQSSGILGEWTVVDQVVAVQDGQKLSSRQLLLNGVDQTYTEVGNEPVSLWMYPHKLAALAGVKPEGANALLLGMGGGSIAHNLIQLGFDLDIVEMDDRIPFIAEKYFGYDPSTANLYIDDARHFVRQASKKYDVVVLDLVNGEVQPSHMFTTEGLSELRKVLTEDALVIVNFQGRFDMEDPALSLGPRSVFKTFEEVGFTMQVSKRSEEDAKNVSADLLMFGTPGKWDIQSALAENIRYNDIFPYETFTINDFEQVEGIQLSDAVLLTDDKQNLELINAPTILDWRRNKMEYTIEGIIKKGLPIYD